MKQSDEIDLGSRLAKSLGFLDTPWPAETPAELKKKKRNKLKVYTTMIII
jgi:hypothetical protein